MEKKQNPPVRSLVYQKPEIREIELDRSISLLMQSANPGGDPDEKLPFINTLNNPFRQ